MNIYAFVRDTCEKADFDVSTSAVQRLVGTLRGAGFADNLSARDITMAEGIISKRLNQLASPQLRTAGLESPMSSTAKFEEIETLRSKNMCPRCKSNMEEVKLATYEDAKFCPACKVALWMDK